ncbi:MAG: hypothetical protein KGR98_06580, partial [Verrucomicrobia bacterium]|nr:hypothetical protein [Verrucomicrobiota bacterium]
MNLKPEGPRRLSTRSSGREDALTSSVPLWPFFCESLRHLFATRCIEAGVDIPTVLRWLGHQDGGALCMKTFGHL